MTNELVVRPFYEIEESLQSLLDTIDLTPEEQKPEIQAEVDKYLGAEVEKVDNIAHVLSALDWEQKCASDEIARLQERKKHAKAAQDRLEGYVCRVLEARGVKKLAGKTTTLSVRPSDGVVIKNEACIPFAYKDVTVKMPVKLWHRLAGLAGAWDPQADELIAEVMPNVKESVSLSEIKKALKAGEEVPGADLEFRSNLVRK